MKLSNYKYNIFMYVCIFVLYYMYWMSIYNTE